MGRRGGEGEVMVETRIAQGGNSSNARPIWWLAPACCPPFPLCLILVFLYGASARVKRNPSDAYLSLRYLFECRQSLWSGKSFDCQHPQSLIKYISMCPNCLVQLSKPYMKEILLLGGSRLSLSSSQRPYGIHLVQPFAWRQQYFRRCNQNLPRTALQSSSFSLYIFLASQYCKRFIPDIRSTGQDQYKANCKHVRTQKSRLK